MSSHSAFFIVNKNGSLVYTRIFAQAIKNSLSTNDVIRLSPTFHSMHAISSQIVPEGAHEPANPLLHEPILEGINEIVTAAFTLKCMQTHTGVKFLLISRNAEKIKEQEGILRGVYEAYADYVGKNPF